MPRITDMRAAPVSYMAIEGLCHGTNLTYKLDGRPSSARVPWVVSNPAVEAARLERQLASLPKLKSAADPARKTTPKAKLQARRPGFELIMCNLDKDPSE